MKWETKENRIEVIALYNNWKKKSQIYFNISFQGEDRDQSGPVGMPLQ